MTQLAGVLTIAYAAFFLYCVLDVVRSEQSEIRVLPRAAWLLVVLFVPLVGCLAWVVAGRPEQARIVRETTRPHSRVSPDHPSVRDRPRRPKGPDDDPAFLRRLDEQLRRSRSDDGDAAD